MPLRLLPDVERLVVIYLRTVSEVSAIVSQRVSTKLPGSAAASLKIRLITGEERVRDHLDATRVQVDAYGGTEIEAETLGRTARAALIAMPATYDTGVVSHVRSLTTPGWNPDTAFTPERPRYTFDVEIVVHPLPQ